jgi:hypothetical protein
MQYVIYSNGKIAAPDDYRVEFVDRSIYEGPHVLLDVHYGSLGGAFERFDVLVYSDDGLFKGQFRWENGHPTAEWQKQNAPPPTRYQTPQERIKDRHGGQDWTQVKLNHASR